MQGVGEWSGIICTASAVCTMAEFLMPKGKVRKIMDCVLGAFIICAIITPFSCGLKPFEFDIKKNFMPKESTAYAKLRESIDSSISSAAKENIKAIVAGILRDIKVNAKKIEIFMDINEDNCIVMIKCKIYVSKEYFGVKEQIKSEIENKLNIKTEVIEV